MADCCDKTGQIEEERRHGIWDEERTAVGQIVRADDRVAVVTAQAGEISVIDRCHLHELELAMNVRVQRNKDQTATRFVVRRIIRQPGAVGHATAEQPMSLQGDVLPVERIA